MPKINEYPLQDQLTGDELFVAETADGTKSVPASALQGSSPDLSELKADVAQLKTDVAELNTELNEVIQQQVSDTTKFTDEVNKLWLVSGKRQHPRAWVYNEAVGSGTGTIEFRDMNESTILPQITFSTGSDMSRYAGTAELQFNDITDITLYVYATFEGSARVRCTCTEIRNDGTTVPIGSFILEDRSDIQGDELGLFYSDPNSDIEIRITDA